MPRPRIKPYWIDRIRILVANKPAMSGMEIRRKLINETRLGQEEPPPTPVPSDRAIRRVMSEFKSAPKEERLPYVRFAWPESMELGALPWEASRAALDLLRACDEAGLGVPLIKEVLWFWRVTQAVPGAPLNIRKDLAIWCAHGEELGVSVSKYLYLEKLLMYQPWKGEVEDLAFKKSQGSPRERGNKRHVLSITLSPWTLPLVGRPVTKPKPKSPATPDREDEP